MTTIDINTIDRRASASAEAAEGPHTTGRMEGAATADCPSATPVVAPERPSHCASRMSASHVASHMTVQEFVACFPVAPGVEIDEASAVTWMNAKETELRLAPTHRQCGTRVFHAGLIDHRLTHLAAFGA